MYGLWRAASIWAPAGKSVVKVYAGACMGAVEVLYKPFITFEVIVELKPRVMLIIIRI